MEHSSVYEIASETTSTEEDIYNATLDQPTTIPINALADTVEKQLKLQANRVSAAERKQTSADTVTLLKNLQTYFSRLESEAEELSDNPAGAFIRAAERLSVQADQEIYSHSQNLHPAEDILRGLCTSLAHRMDYWDAKETEHGRHLGQITGMEAYMPTMDEDHDEQHQTAQRLEQSSSFSAFYTNLYDGISKVYHDTTGYPFTRARRTKDRSAAAEIAANKILNNHATVQADPSMTFRAAVFGGREYTNSPHIHAALNELLRKQPTLTIYTGTQKGFEAIVRSWCETNDVQCISTGPTFPPKTGDSKKDYNAGCVAMRKRNELIVKDAELNGIILFPSQGYFTGAHWDELAKPDQANITVWHPIKKQVIGQRVSSRGEVLDTYTA